MLCCVNVPYLLNVLFSANSCRTSSSTAKLISGHLTLTVWKFYLKESILGLFLHSHISVKHWGFNCVCVQALKMISKMLYSICHLSLLHMNYNKVVVHTYTIYYIHRLYQFKRSQIWQQHEISTIWKVTMTMTARREVSWQQMYLELSAMFNNNICWN